MREDIIKLYILYIANVGVVVVVVVIIVIVPFIPCSLTAFHSTFFLFANAITNGNIFNHYSLFILSFNYLLIFLLINQDPLHSFFSLGVSIKNHVDVVL